MDAASLVSAGDWMSRRAFGNPGRRRALAFTEVARLQKSLHVVPDRFPVYMEIARLYLQAKFFDQALPFLHKAARRRGQ
jgi:hypothetical protein